MTVPEYIMDTIVGNGSRGYSGDGQKATVATLNEPFHIDFDYTEKHLYIADCFNYSIRKVDLESNIFRLFAEMDLKVILEMEIKQLMPR